MKWYTCTPVPFKGDHTFFSRDSGAFCKAFQRIGLESRAIMPTPVQEGDDPDLIRTEYANLEDAAWWKSLGIDGLVLYAWGTGKYLPIARAIHDAGIFLVVYMDSSGLFFPWQYWLPIAENMWTRDVFAAEKSGAPPFPAAPAETAHLEPGQPGKKKTPGPGGHGSLPHAGSRQIHSGPGMALRKIHRPETGPHSQPHFLHLPLCREKRNIIMAWAAGTTFSTNAPSC